MVEALQALDDFINSQVLAQHLVFRAHASSWKDCMKAHQALMLRGFCDIEANCAERADHYRAPSLVACTHSSFASWAFELLLCDDTPMLR
eukprot:5035746-Amphidinium_carterae.1